MAEGLIDNLFCRVWWQFNPSAGSWFDGIYHWFNLLEGAVWFFLAVLVLRRCQTCRKSRVEILYAAAFAVFGGTDMVEAWQQSSALIWFKLINLVLLWKLRREVMSRWYPDARIW